MQFQKGGRQYEKILVIICLVAVGLFFFIGKLEGDNKLFAKALPSHINEANEIKEITIYEVKPVGKPKAISLTEKEDIAKVLKAAGSMELEKGNEFVSSGYLLLFQGSKESYSLTVNKDGKMDMDGHKEHYDIKGSNELFQVIQTFNDKWEHLDEEEV
ncbi:hypothetical protein [Oceanobacillus sp. J11TS1]|uniref:hypothetical protein n=1 Tax=Oceanobacillus sp. J11TS1 TaxID=2807191 RepID=UPI001B27E9BA|nr:hypothetical protein [Oceanobacillus sp. J11TS1]GIO25264.1 hypothetical protein J11TS1_38450 [Oceanobacillus sp. J11TS1]